VRYTVTTFKVHLDVAESGIRLKDSKDAEIIARGIFNRLDADKEHFVVMGTNNKNQINGYKEVSTGTLTSSLVTPGEVFLAALRLRAAAIICVHNHPSGDPAPSQEDVEITRRLKECGEMFAIRVLDHVILGADRYYRLFGQRAIMKPSYPQERRSTKHVDNSVQNRWLRST